MKANLKALLCILFIMLNIILYAQVPLEYAVNKTNGAITIDGNLNDASWSLADTTTHFVVLGETTSPATETWSKILWDDDYLYIAFYCEDVKLWATYSTHDDQLWQEDAVEIYIDPDGDGLNYIELEVNPLNATFDLWLNKPWDEGGSGNSAWDFDDITNDVTIDGTVADNSDTDNSWICEMALPFSEMSFIAESMNYPPNNNDMWRFNLYRFDRESTNDPNGEPTGWSQTSGGQHEPEYFGKITFIDESGPETLPESIASAEGINLLQNYPNPFSDISTIRFNCDRPTIGSLIIADISGRIVYTEAIEIMQAGNYSCVVNADDFNSGPYFYSIITNNGRSVIKEMFVTR